MATIMNTDRIEELSNYPVRIKTGEIEHLCAMAKRTFELEEKYRQFGDLQSEIDKWKHRATEASKQLGETQNALGRCKRDIAHSDNFIQSLTGRLQDAVAGELQIRRWNEELDSSIHKCIDRQELGPVASLNPTLLRLQEALESTIHEAPPAK